MATKRLKNAKLDELMSSLIRERDDWTCRDTGFVDSNGQMVKKSRVIDTCHIYGRRTVSLRWYPTNMIALTSSRHRYFTENPLEFKAFVERLLGPHKFWSLVARFNNPSIKYTNKDRQDMYAHYSEQLENLLDQRCKGRTGVLTVVPYD